MTSSKKAVICGRNRKGERDGTYFSIELSIVAGSISSIKVEAFDTRELGSFVVSDPDYIRDVRCLRAFGDLGALAEKLTNDDGNYLTALRINCGWIFAVCGSTTSRRKPSTQYVLDFFLECSPDPTINEPFAPFKKFRLHTSLSDLNEFFGPIEEWFRQQDFRMGVEDEV